jgi:imidazolonepropionase-like amidohydrolase
MIKRSVLLLCAFVAGCATSPSTPRADLILVAVNVVDVEAGRVRPDHDVSIRAGRIVSVRPSVGGRSVAGVRTVDGRGKYVIPALWDLHVHLESLRPSDAPRLDPRSWQAPLAISYGVVGLRDLGSRTTDILTLRDAYAARRTAGAPAPILVAAGQAFSGKNPWGSPDHLLPVETPEQAKTAVQQQIARGVDLIKVHDFLAPDVYRAVVTTAREGGKAVTGHLRPFAGPLEAARLGQTGFEHLPTELLAYCGSHGERDTNAFYSGWYTGGPGYYERSMAKLHASHRDGCPAVFAALATLNVAITPTLSSRAPVSGRTSAAARRFLPPQYLRSCDQAKASREEVAEADRDAYTKMLVDVFRQLRDANVAILTGTDGVPEGCAIPGLILLDEMDALVAAGLSRSEVLRSATVYAARKAGVADAGVVSPGALADLVMLGGNPLEDFSVLEEPAGIVVAGIALDRDEVLELRQQAARYARSLRP